MASPYSRGLRGHAAPRRTGKGVRFMRHGLGLSAPTMWGLARGIAISLALALAGVTAIAAIERLWTLREPPVDFEQRAPLSVQPRAHGRRRRGRRPRCLRGRDGVAGRRLRRQKAISPPPSRHPSLSVYRAYPDLAAFAGPPEEPNRLLQELCACLTMVVGGEPARKEWGCSGTWSVWW